MKRRYLLLTGDARAEMSKLPAGKVRVCVCSPPYYGLRWYGQSVTSLEEALSTRQWWGGYDYPECEHNFIDTYGPNMTGGTGPASAKQVTNQGSQFGNQLEEPPSQLCTYCGKWFGELGREPNPTMYVDHLLEVFDEVRRLLTEDGTFWLNIGDSYAGSGKGPTGHNGIGNQEKRQGFKSKGVGKLPPGYKHKDLLGIPFRVSDALRAAGWYFRQVNIWEKDNPFPESVRDRSSTAHEYIFQFSKSRRYFYDYNAVAEPIEPFIDKDGKLHTHKNQRSVWHFQTQPYKGHSAVFPEELPKRCILAGSQPGDVVLDPFSGSATTGVAALRHGRRYLGIDLIPKYTSLGEERIKDSGVLSLDQASLEVS